MPPPDVERILCVRPDGIGDMICATPAFACLRAAFPEAHLAVLASPLNAPMLAGHPAVSESTLYDPKVHDRSLGRLFAVAREVRHRRFDLVFALRTSAATHLITALSGARRRVGYRDKPFGRSLTHAMSAGHAWGDCHEVDRNLRLLDLVGVPTVTRKPQLYLSEREREGAAAWMASHGVLADTPVIAVHPGASSEDKCWPEERFADAASTLAATAGSATQVVVLGDPREVARVHRVRERLTVPSVTATDLTLREMAAVFQRCRLALVNDSGPMHVASALGVPLVALFGPTDHVRWRPLGAHARVLVADPTGPRGGPIEAISTDDVITAGIDLLSLDANEEASHG